MTLDTQALIGFIDAEFRQRFRSVIDQLTLPIARRVDQYTCWPGLKVVHCSPESGHLELSFKRNPSKIRVGEYVYVNVMSVEPKDVISGPEGVVETIDEHRGLLRLRPGYQQRGRFGNRFRMGDMLVLDQTLPAARMSREMPMLALRRVTGELGETPRTRRIKAILEGREQARDLDPPTLDFDEDPHLSRLNLSQRKALIHALSHDLSLIQGPPGTGKTFVLGLIVRELVRQGLKVAVCAFTHQAINNVLLECLAYDEIHDITKIGNPSSWRSDTGSEKLRLVASPGSFFRNRKTPCVTGLTQYAAFFPIARDLERPDGEEEPHRFDVLVFDEASQLTIPAALMAMLQCDRFIFAGDHRQLPPVVSSMKAGQGVAASIFQHLAETAGHGAKMLKESFRLNRGLVAFPSREFYDGRLVSAPVAEKRTLQLKGRRQHADILQGPHVVQLVLVRHEGRGQESPEEAALVADLVRDAVEGGLSPGDIAVIAPHRRQNVRIREFLAQCGMAAKDVLVDTVERIQGQERDLVILSMTLSDPDVLSAEIDFLYLPNRFNVAMTRARKKLIVVASPPFFRALPRPETFDCTGPDPLPEINVLKRWYFEHREAAIDATTVAAQRLHSFTDTSRKGDTEKA